MEQIADIQAKSLEEEPTEEERSRADSEDERTEAFEMMHIEPIDRDKQEENKKRKSW